MGLEHTGSGEGLRSTPVKQFQDPTKVEEKRRELNDFFAWEEACFRVLARRPTMSSKSNSREHTRSEVHRVNEVRNAQGTHSHEHLRKNKGHKEGTGEPSSEDTVTLAAACFCRDGDRDVASRKPRSTEVSARG